MSPFLGLQPRGHHRKDFLPLKHVVLSMEMWHGHDAQRLADGRVVDSPTVKCYTCHGVITV